MKKWISLLLVGALLLSGCGRKEPPIVETTTAPTTAPTTEPSTEPTTEPTTEPAPVYTNPLNGQVLDEPYTGRVYAVSVSNVRDALPHYGTMKADIVMEMWVNHSIIRNLALFTNPQDAQRIGSVRSDRLMFNQIALHYDAIVVDAAGSNQVLNDARNKGVDRLMVDTSGDQDYAVRDTSRDFLFKPASKYEHCLFAKGDGLQAYAELNGFSTTQPEDKDYGLRFREDGTPEGGETANTVSLTFTYKNNLKATDMVYDADLDQYVYHQYEKEMIDGATGEQESFTNVIIMLADITRPDIYYVANFTAGGTGYYACGGKIIPITWSCEDENSPFRFQTLDGQPLELGVGNTYMAIAPQASPVSYS